MQKGPQYDQSMEKLKSLISSRFGKSIELRRLANVQSYQSPYNHILLNKDLHIPLKIENAFLGTAVIPEADDLPDENHLQIAQVVRMILEPTLYRDFLERSEENLRNANPSQSPFIDISEVYEDVESSLDLPILLSNLIHLHGHDENRIKRAALLLHEITGRWAFAPLKDFIHEMTSIHDFIKLGALTLYLENVEDLPEGFQHLLIEYLSSPRSSEDPILVTGSTKNLAEISQSEKLLPKIKDELVINTLELDRTPLSERGLKEVLGLMFFATKGES